MEFKPTRRQIARVKALANSCIANLYSAAALAKAGYVGLADVVTRSAENEAEIAFAIAARVAEVQP